MKLAPGAIGQSGPPVRAALSQCSVWEAHGEKRFWKYCSHLPPSSCRQMVTISVRFLMCLLDQHHAREPSSGQGQRAHRSSELRGRSNAKEADVYSQTHHVALDRQVLELTRVLPSMIGSGVWE